MKKLFNILCLFSAIITFVACNDYETYAEKREKEDAAISKFIDRNTEVAKTLFSKPISVISETDFEKAGYKTDISKNEYVLFETSGVYMQIMDNGCGNKIKEGETTNVLCRFDEYNILGDSLQLSNISSFYNLNPDKMTVINTYGTFTGIFTSSEESLLAYAYSSTSVPSGWLIPLRYVQVGRPTKESESIAKVRIIVPSAQGHSNASSQTYPCFYELTYERGK